MRRLRSTKVDSEVTRYASTRQSLCSSELHSTLSAPDNSTVGSGELDVSSDIPVDFVHDETSEKLTSVLADCE
ncbi:hypothetical protein K439DRAFT_711913 [Ramaria rubella]|nr:hypothetical protein K439DRAFT_711913 [Ramaria rubella]